MNVYDFDGTIYDGDSTYDLIKYTLKKYPKYIYLLVPAGFRAIAYFFKIIDKAKLKVGFYRILIKIPNLDLHVKEFWDNNINKIYPWYYDKQKKDDLIISASPDFSINEICNRLNIKHVIASKIDLNTGETIGKNNDGPNKVDRFVELYDVNDIDEFYSDSRNDRFMAKLAKKAFYVNKGKIEPW